MHVCIVNLTRGALSGGYSKYLKVIEPMMRADERIGRLTVFSPPEVEQQGGAGHLTWPRRDRWSGYPALRAALRELEPDVVFFPTAAHLDCGSIPTVIMVRNMEPLLVPWEGNSLSDGFRNVVRRSQARRSCERATRVIAVSEHVRDHLTRRWKIDPSKVGVVPHGVDAPSVDGSPPAVLGGGREPFLFTAGSLRPARGLEDVIRALAIANARGRGLRLVIGGTSTPGAEGYRSSMARLAERLGVGSAVLWAGQLTAGEMGWCFANATAFVMTSRAEACPNTVLEAMSHGAFSISTDAPPMPEFFGSTALFYRRRDAESLAERIAEAASVSPQTNSARRSAARTRASRYTWEATVHGEIRELENALRTPSNKR